MKIYKYVKPERIDVLKNLKIRFTQPYLFNDPFEMNPNIISFFNYETLRKLMDDNFDKLKEILITQMRNRYSNLYSCQKKLNILSDLLYYIYYFKLKDSKDINNKDFIRIISDNYFDLFKGDEDEITNLIIKFRELLDNDDFIKENYSNILNSLSNFIQYGSYQHLDELKEGFNKALKDKFCILSLTSKKDNFLMWSHYADEHKGFVLEFDGNHKFFNQRKSDNDLINQLKEVKYSYNRPPIEIIDEILYKKNDFTNFIDCFLMAKSVEWQYEKEYRMIRFSKEKNEVIKCENNKEIYLFKIPPDLIKTIYIGCRANKDFIDEIYTILKANSELSHINIYKAEIDNKEYKLNFINLDGLNKT